MTKHLVDVHILCMPDRDPEAAIESCRHPGVRLWVAQSTGDHIGAQRAALIERGTAPLVGFCDDDDEWLPGGLDALMSQWEPNAGVGGVYGDEERVHPDGSRTVYGGPWSVKRLLSGMGGPHNGVLFDRAKLAQHLPALATYKTADGIFLRRSMAPYQYVDHMAYRYNQHPQQTTRTRPDRGPWITRAQAETISHLRAVYRDERRSS